MINNKKASIFIFILILVNIILILWYVVFNNVTVMNNNIDIWKNAEEVFINVQQKWDINIKTDIQYNSNWNWFNDFISCPTNVTMSWSIYKVSSISTEMHYSFWSYFCLGDYNWKEFRIFFDKDTHDFTKAFFEWDIVNIVTTLPSTKWTNLAPWSNVVASTRYSSYYDKSYAYDNVVDSREYITKYEKDNFIQFDFWSEKSLDSMEIYKNSHLFMETYYWDTAYINYFDLWWNYITSSSLSWMRWNNYDLVDFRNLWIDSWVRYIQINENSWNKKYLDLKEVKIFESVSWWASSIRVWERKFNDTDNTLLSFDSTGVWWGDNYDDDFNSDDYKLTSTWTIFYPGWFQDDDVIPRLTIFWDVRESNTYQNIFWSNYKTNEFIEKNTNNNDWINLKMWDITDWYFYLDLFSLSENIKFDLKLYEFDRNAYENDNTLLLLKSYEVNDLEKNSWFIEFDGNNLGLSTTKTANTMSFDFKNNDYAIFLINKLDSNLSYRLTWETNTWTWIYINPIDDSWIWTIESLSNHMIIWNEKNFIWEQFVIVWSK